MNKVVSIIVLLLFAALVPKAHAQTTVSDKIVPDTVLNQNQYDESTRFYDQLKEKSRNSKFSKRLYQVLVTSDRRRRVPVDHETTMEKEITYFQEYEGRTISSITVLRNNVFDSKYPRGDIRTTANYLHVVTREDRIWRNLLFAEGDPLSPIIMANSENLLKQQDYLAEATILVSEDEESEGVDIYVITRDSWSIGITIRSVPEGNRYLELSDDNFLGRGNKLDLRSYFSMSGQFYGGEMFEYTISNFLGSFFELSTLFGWGFDERRLGVKLNKEFILPSDYLAGVVAEDNKYYDSQMQEDTVLLVRHQNYDAWVGKSWDFPAANSSFFITSRYNDLKYKRRPDVLPDSNGYYHNRQTLLFGTGIYRERYYTGNMIYGFGRNENIPYGHRFEFTGGRSWGEFQDRWYTALSATIGRQNRWGYLRGEASASTYWNRRGSTTGSIATFEADWFSNLWKFNRNYIRQFGRIRYMQGWSREKGEGDVLTFWDDSAPQGIRRTGFTGTNRLIMNTETVLFTPIYFYGFRFVFFAFGDMGWIGNKPFVVENEFFSSVGVGVRLKNERLNINTIQLRFGIGFGRHGLVDYNHFRYSSQSRFRIPQFKASRPEEYKFR